MKHRFLCLLISLTLLLALLTGCEIHMGIQDHQPQFNVSIGDPEDHTIRIHLGEDGPDFNIDLQKILTMTAQEGADSLLGIPPYEGTPYISINDNIPYFAEDEITDQSFEYYSPLDHLGRCGITMASIGRDLMPTEKRESIRDVHPTGWQSISYDFVDGKSLYNRCHLIGFQLAGENANERNLITGTRSLNIHGMLPFENMVADYVKETGNHVMYRVTPIFNGDNLVADGVLMEGLSVEDHGEGITFCVYAYNAEPGVAIDYKTGSNWPVEASEAIPEEEESQVYILNTSSKKFHRVFCHGAENISEENKEIYRGSRESLIEMGYKPCGGCTP